MVTYSNTASPYPISFNFIAILIYNLHIPFSRR